MDKNPVICIGAALIDECFTCLENPVTGTSNPASYHRSSGGVACNIANHLSLLGNRVELISHFGNDPDGKWLSGQCRLSGVGTTASVFNDSPSGKYVALLSPDGELFAGASTGNLDTIVSPSYLNQQSSFLKTASIIIVDCNLSKESLEWIVSFCKQNNIPCVIEPVSISKATRLQNMDLKEILLITPNNDEVKSITGNSNGANHTELMNALLARGVKYVWKRNSKDGSEIFSLNNKYNLTAPQVDVIDITGAGDAALAGWVHAWLMKKEINDCLRYGHAMSSIILRTEGAIQRNLSTQMLEAVVRNMN